MQAETTSNRHDEPRMLGSAARPMIAVGAVLAIGGAGVACLLGLGGPASRSLFFHAYLVAFLLYLSITLGALFFVLLHHLSRAGWSVTVRRLAEAIGGNVGLMALMAIPLFVGLADLYPWAACDASCHGSMAPDKAAYLNPSAFAARLAIYFAVWGFLAWWFRSCSIRQDETGDPAISRRMERLSAPGMIALAATMSLAAFDLFMSLDPAWVSTAVGVYFFSGCVLGGLVVLTLLALGLQRSGRLGAAVTTEHYHDLGKLTFAFVFFWAYIAFSQYLLIWYANMPGETQFYIPRQLGGWAAVSLALVFFQFLVPFAGLMSRHAKRRLPVFAFWAIWLLAARWLDFFWLVMPNYFVRRLPAVLGVPADTPLSDMLKQLIGSNQAVFQVAEKHGEFMQVVNQPFAPASLAIAIGLAVGLGGLYLANTARLMGKAALVPQRDPRLPEALSFENQ